MAAGLDRYFGGRPGEAAKARKRLHAKHGVAAGERAFQDLVSSRRGEYAGRGRGVGLQRILDDDA